MDEFIFFYYSMQMLYAIRKYGVILPTGNL
jgi:hypothetical protein